MPNGDHARIHWLDTLRGIAILLVLLFHFTTRYAAKYNSFPDPLPFRIEFGWIGVHLFFMISGFIIYSTIQKKRNSVDFLVARLSRLLPPYWTAIVLVLLLEYPHEALFHVANRNEWSTTLANAAMIPDLLHLRLLEGAFWSLFVEVKFYVFFALLWQLVDLKNNRIFYLSYCILLIFAGIHYFIHRLPYGENFYYFLIFWTGIAACKLIYEKMPVRGFLLITLLTTVSTWGLYAKGPELIIGIPVFSGLFMLSPVIFNRYPWLGTFLKPLSQLGRISYSYYLVHQSVGYIILGLCAALAINQILSIGFAIAICVGIAWMGFRYIEQLSRPIAAFVMNAIISKLTFRRKQAPDYL